MEKLKAASRTTLRRRDCDRLLILLELLRARHDHPDAQTCHRLIQKEVPNIGLSTVYRHLATLVNNGLINEIRTDDGPARYDADVQSHGHFMCTACGHLTDLMPITVKADYPGQIRSFVFLAKGTCRACLKK